MQVTNTVRFFLLVAPLALIGGAIEAIATGTVSEFLSW